MRIPFFSKPRKLLNTKRMLLQWHITEHCNLRCKHCYHTGYDSKDLSFQQISDIFYSYKLFYNQWFTKQNLPVRAGHINITGGEPFLRNDLFDLLRLIKNDDAKFTFALLTNGTLLNDTNCKELKQLKPEFIQISVEGNKETNDNIRGKGSYEQIEFALQLLRKYKIKTYISFTANKLNFEQFESVAQLAVKQKVAKLWTDRIVPFGNALENELLILSAKDTQTFHNHLVTVKEKYSNYKSTKIELNRALQFLATGDCAYSCSAGNTLITIMHNGDVYPCRRLPILVGNVLRENLTDIYEKNETMKSLQSPQNKYDSCSRCSYFTFCKGGSRCITFAQKNTFNDSDPGCFLALDNYQQSRSSTFPKS